jgi:hypothetical protein
MKPIAVLKGDAEGLAVPGGVPWTGEAALITFSDSAQT